MLNRLAILIIPALIFGNCAVAAEAPALPCSIQVADAAARFAAAGFTPPEKPMQSSVFYRGSVAINGADYRALAAALRDAALLCHTGQDLSAENRLSPALATLGRLGV